VTGLGLKQIAEMHGGRIWVESILGKGSIFQMELPIRAEFRKSAPCGSAPSSLSTIKNCAGIEEERPGDRNETHVAILASACC
jgi:hypothetical protein